jgi:hypothetical protein
MPTGGISIRIKFIQKLSAQIPNRVKQCESGHSTEKKFSNIH